MVDTPEEVVVLLVRGPDLKVKAVRLHRVAALLPLQSLALLLVCTSQTFSTRGWQTLSTVILAQYTVCPKKDFFFLY